MLKKKIYLLILFLISPTIYAQMTLKNIDKTDFNNIQNEIIFKMKNQKKDDVIFDLAESFALINNKEIVGHIVSFYTDENNIGVCRFAFKPVNQPIKIFDLLNDPSGPDDDIPRECTGSVATSLRQIQNNWFLLPIFAYRIGIHRVYDGKVFSVNNNIIKEDVKLTECIQSMDLSMYPNPVSAEDMRAWEYDLRLNSSVFLKVLKKCLK